MEVIKWSDGTKCEKSTRVKKCHDQLFIIQQSKREAVNEKMSHRENIPQISINPFMIHNKYLDDLETQNQFLTPQDSNNSA